jgi:hypothetical protein
MVLHGAIPSAIIRSSAIFVYIIRYLFTYQMLKLGWALHRLLNCRSSALIFNITWPPEFIFRHICLHTTLLVYISEVKVRLGGTPAEIRSSAMFVDVTWLPDISSYAIFVYIVFQMSLTPPPCLFTLRDWRHRVVGGCAVSQCSTLVFRFWRYFTEV